MTDPLLTCITTDGRRNDQRNCRRPLVPNAHSSNQRNPRLQHAHSPLLLPRRHRNIAKIPNRSPLPLHLLPSHRINCRHRSSRLRNPSHVLLHHGGHAGIRLTPVLVLLTRQRYTRLARLEQSKLPYIHTHTPVLTPSAY